MLEEWTEEEEREAFLHTSRVNAAKMCSKYLWCNLKYHQQDIVEISFMFPDGTFKPHTALIVSNDELQEDEGFIYVWFHQKPIILSTTML